MASLGLARAWGGGAGRGGGSVVRPPGAPASRRLFDRNAGRMPALPVTRGAAAGAGNRKGEGPRMRSLALPSLRG